MSTENQDLQNGWSIFSDISLQNMLKWASRWIHIPSW